MKSSDLDVMNGKREAFCKYCHTYLRPHHTDLVNHAGTNKHKNKVVARNRRLQSALQNHGKIFQIKFI